MDLGCEENRFHQRSRQQRLLKVKDVVVETVTLYE